MELKGSHVYKSLSISARARIIAALIEGNSLRSTSRLCDVAFNTVLKLVPEIGIACADYHDAHVRRVRARRIQCDAIWQFVGARAKNVTPEQKLRDGTSHSSDGQGYFLF